MSMADPMDREMIYSFLYEEIALYKDSIERHVYTDNELELLVRVSALTDAVLYERLTTPEARYLLRGFIDSCRAPAPAPALALEVEPEPEEGSIRF